ncbi:HesA/MoeB/ThiF family protein [Kangiella sediminilitoris]|uniref:Molybdopterin-synthase adenylyltransferase n=1 Tax=Kangiella sediminilitoris TaxID=1144748 RepID=A0A1B3BAK8_9GAMM|nr:HesA/MoeB/ThiF family protein [Kangiella sediminilitoris]AOE49830.1 UBA/THIF-type NAD/FAD binding protein [Kangiella sediminilitoris]
MLSQKELIQYSRQIILPEIDVEGQEKIKSSHIAIIGMGGLGSSAAMYLAAAGVGNLTIIDHDVVERSNLQRQIIHQVSGIGRQKVESAKETLQGINPDINVNVINKKATQEQLSELTGEFSFDVILDCSDNFDTRFAINRASVIGQIPLVSATAVGFKGQLAIFNLSSKSACYHCLYSAMNLPEGNCEEQGILSPVVGTMGCLQATEALKIISGLTASKESFLLAYDSISTQFKSFNVPKDPSCVDCKTNTTSYA